LAAGGGKFAPDIRTDAAVDSISIGRPAVIA